MQALNDKSHTLECPKLCPKPMVGGALQKRSTHAGQLLSIELGRATALRHTTQCINAAFIEKSLPCIYGLLCHTYGQRHFGTALSRKQHSTCLHSLFRRLAQSSFCHDYILQYRY
jgi:hypothetical protein